MVVLFSFHSSPSLNLPFQGFSLRWYRDTFRDVAFRDAAVNSVIVAFSVALTTLVLGTLAAYGLSRSTSRLRRPLTLLFFLPITLPGLFIGIAMLVLFSQLRVTTSLVTIAAGHFVFVLPYFLIIALVALERLDPALEETAADLGANPWRTFRLVTLPILSPVLLGATCLAFALSFDEFIITLFVAGSQSTLPLFVWSRLRRTIDPSVNVVSTLLIATSLVLWAVSFLVLSRARRIRSLSPDEIAAP